MHLTEIEQLLAARIGFDLQSIGTQAVRSVIRRSMHEAGYSDPTEYARKLANDSKTWNCLVDRVVIPETWFFRDGAPFELVADIARTHTRRASEKMLRILSCPCSSGEEPYSLVIAMLHAGVRAESFCVDAVDLSQSLLEMARAGLYGARSFRNESHWYRAAYFDAAEGHGSWLLRHPVAALVQFSQGNLIEPDFLEKREPYDLVFCRNLLIYFHPEARLRAITVLSQLLAPDGTLVLGHAEAAFARENGFTQAGPASAFAFRKPRSGVIRKLMPPQNRGEELARFVPASPPIRSAPIVPIALAPDRTAPTPDPELSPLELARQLGDAGQLDDAQKVCSQYLQAVPDNADAYFLSGVLHNAQGRADLAVSLFRKALYLDPNHREALLHLALSREALGDKPGAALLRARALRHPDPDAAGEL